MKHCDGMCSSISFSYSVKKKKMNVSILFRTLSLMCCFCLFVSTSSFGKSWEAISDLDFSDGLLLSPLHPADVAKRGGWPKASLKILQFTDSSKEPSWHLCQWHSRHSLASAPRQESDGAVSYENAAKSVKRWKNGQIRLELNASQEYDHPRKQNEMWPHLLIEQDFVKHPNVGRSAKLRLRMSLRLEKEENCMKKEEFDVGLHSAQCPLYFVVRNVSRASKDYGHFIWFGIHGYDFREHQMRTKEIISWDVASNTYIYVAPQMDMWGNVALQDNQWHRVDVDIRPYIVVALAKMQEKGFFKQTKLEDLEITGMNFGWEVPGTLNAAVSLKGLSLKVKDKK